MDSRSLKAASPQSGVSFQLAVCYETQAGSLRHFKVDKTARQTEKQNELQWWDDVQPMLVNENVTGPSINPFQALYYQQFGGSPTPQDLNRMNPKQSAVREKSTPRKTKAKADK